MKQTAVDFLLEELYKLTALSDFLDKEDFIKARTMIFEQAKAMEKEQMRTASCPYIGGWEEGEFEYWYNETYNKDESKTNL